MKTFYTMIFLLMISVCGFSQTGIIDDFEDGTATGWVGNDFTLTETGGELQITGTRGDMWSAFDYNFSAIDMSANPHISLDVRATHTFNLYTGVGINFTDGNGIAAYTVFYPTRINVVPYAGTEQEIVATSTMQQYSFDYTGITFELEDGAVFNGITGPAVLTESQILSAISNVHFLPNPLGLYPGTPGESPVIYFDNLRVGSDAYATPGIAAVPDQEWTVMATGTPARTVALKNIADGAADDQSINISATSSNTALIPDPTVNYSSPERTGSLTLSPNDNVVGESTISVTVSSPAVADDKVMTFVVRVNANAAPTMNAIDDIMVVAGQPTRIKLTNVNDGNAEAEQTITVSATSSNTGLIPDPSSTYDAYYHDGYIEFTPDGSVTPGSTVDITVNLADNGGTTSGGVDNQDYTFTATIYDEINGNVMYNEIPDIGTPGTAGTHTFTITGVTDGDDETQNISWTVSSSNTGIVSSASVGSVSDGVAVLSYDFTGTLGSSTITLRATDDGGNAGNNGNTFHEQTFEITAMPVPITGLVVDFEAGGDPGSYGFSAEAGYTLAIENGELHVTCDYPANSFPGMWWNITANTGGAELDLSANPYVNIVFRNSTSNDNGLEDETLISLFLWDPDLYPDEGYLNTNKSIRVPEDGVQRELEVDFSNTFYEDANGFQVDSTRINSILINLDNRWFYAVQGDYWIDEIRMGDSAIIQEPPTNTIDDVPNQLVNQGDTPEPVILSGISNGEGQANTDLTYTISNSALVTGLTIGAVSNGSAELTYTLGGGTGSCEINVIANNVARVDDFPDTAKFSIYVYDGTTGTSTVTIDQTTEHQTFTGFGGVLAGDHSQETVDIINDMNWTMMRIFGNFDQMEAINDNGDPNVLAQENLNPDEEVIELLKLINDNTNCNTFFYTPLSQPTWMKVNKSEFPYEGHAWIENNHIDPGYYEEYAEYLVGMVKMIKEKTGIELYAISIQNEPAFNEPYGSTQIGPQEFADIFSVVGPRFAAEGLNTKIIASEDVHLFGWVTDRINAINNEPNATDHLGVIGFHAYTADGIGNDFADRATYEALHDLYESTSATDLWMTESSGWCDVWEGDWGRQWDGTVYWQNGPFGLAGGMFMLYKYGQITGWTSLDGTGFLSGKKHIQAANKHFSKFTNPGDVQIETSSDDADILPIAFKDPNTDNIALTLLNTSQEVKVVDLSGANLPTYFRTITSKSFAPWVEQTPVTSQIVMAPRSIATLYSGVSNVAPTIDPISNQSYLLSDGAQTINLSGISDGNPDQVQALTVTAISSNTTAADVSVSYTSDNATGSLTVTPNDYGQTTITITVQDDGGTANSGSDSREITFTVDVLSELNEKPTIDVINDLTILEDAAATIINLAGITDGDDNSQNLTVTATSSNTDLIPNPTVTYTSNDATGTLSITPTADTSGTVEITVIVSDDGGNANNNGDQSEQLSFIVTVDAVNDAPEIRTISDLNVFEYVSSFPINFNDVDDGDPDVVQTITVTAVSSNPSFVSTSVDYTSGNTSGDIMLNLLQETNGSATITVTVQDDGGTANGGVDQTSFEFDVNLNLDGSTEISEMISDRINIYPNPAAEYITVSTANKAMINSFKVIDLSGKTIMSNTKVSDKIINIPVYQLSKGTYLLQLDSGKGSMQRTFIKH